MTEFLDGLGCRLGEQLGGQSAEQLGKQFGDGVGEQELEETRRELGGTYGNLGQTEGGNLGDRGERDGT